jgi:Bardet-Biedl syndrome 5 protein
VDRTNFNPYFSHHQCLVLTSKGRGAKRARVAMPDAKKPDDPKSVWQDREIRFDMAVKGLALRKGEFEIDHLEGVEDTKGNNGERGTLVVTNLRVIWFSKRSRRTNLSIGYNSVSNISMKTASSRLRGKTQSLYVMTRFQGSKFEFIFTNLDDNSPRLFTTVQAVYRAYDTSRLYRDLKLRGAIIADKELKLLPKEETYNRISGVWNLSSEQGNLGTFFVTNVRVVWHANMAENFNVSIPYVQMKSVTVRDSKFGRALVIHTTSRSGGYVLGFRVDPAEKLDEIYKEVDALFKVFSVNPVFGVDFKVEDASESLRNVTKHRESDDVEIIGEGGESDPLAAYYAEGGKDVGRENDPNNIVYCPRLGMAVQRMPEGVTTEMLWNIL